MLELPTGTVTFLFTDIEGSTRLLQELGTESYAHLQDRHAAIMRAAIESGHGVEIRTEGDAFFAVFATPGGALDAAIAAQRALAPDAGTDGRSIRVRIGLHTGEGILGGDDYVGIDVHRAARIAATGHGGQIVLSDATRGLVAHSLADGITIRDLGLHRLKDLDHPQHLHDVVIDDLEANFPPLRSIEARRTNLPPPRTSFVGRDREITEIAELVRTHRLLTLTGPGGTGKTRLALQVAAGQLDRFADGVSFVDLSTVTDPDLVLPEIARVLGAREVPGRDPADAVHDHLRERELLLVLDNLEQLVASAAVVGALLDAAPGLSVLATSRISLRLAGEREYRVDPLDAPEPDRPLDAERLSTYGSVRLFADRAAAVRPGFSVTAETAPAIARIVARLDGLPLALELAASRMRILSPSDLAERLDHALAVLTDGPRDAPERQRTLRGAIRWGDDLLEPNEQRLFARLSVFSGGWILGAAEAVCGPDLAVLDGMSALVNASLVRQSELEHGELRFSMLETIREFATERLDASDERDTIHRRHGQRFLELAEEAEPHLTGEHQMHWLAILEREHDNVRIALDRAERSGDARDVDTGLRSAAAIWRFWQQRGHLREGRARLERLLALDDVQPRGAARARALGALGGVAYWQTDFEPAHAAYEEAVDIAREIEDPQLLSWSLFNLSFMPMMLEDDVGAAMVLIRESLATALDEDLALRAQIWTAIGFFHHFLRELPAAIAAMERGIAMHREVGERLALCESLVGLAAAELALDHGEAARTRLAEATRIAAESPGPIVVANVVLPNAVLANLEGDPRRAAQLVGAWAYFEEDLNIHFPPVAMSLYGDPGSEARAALGDAAFEQAHAEGFAMTLGEIVDLVTDLADRSDPERDGTGG